MGRLGRKQTRVRSTLQLAAKFRRIATRYNKLAENLLTMFKLASKRLWSRAYESTA